MKSRIVSLSLAAALAISVSMSMQGQEDRPREVHQPRLIEFDAPGAATVSSPACAPACGTFAYANNDLGMIVGYYTDANVVPHGFLRTPEGRFVSFDAPGA